jgi:hypothetical protein
VREGGASTHPHPKMISKRMGPMCRDRPGGTVGAPGDLRKGSTRRMDFVIVGHSEAEGLGTLLAFYDDTGQLV